MCDVTCLTQIRLTRKYDTTDPFIYRTCLTPTCLMCVTDSYAQHNSSDGGDKEHGRDSFVRVACLIHMCDMPYSYMTHAYAGRFS